MFLGSPRLFLPLDALSPTSTRLRGRVYACPVSLRTCPSSVFGCTPRTTTSTSCWSRRAESEPSSSVLWPSSCLGFVPLGFQSSSYEYRCVSLNIHTSSTDASSYYLLGIVLHPSTPLAPPNMLSRTPLLYLEYILPNFLDPSKHFNPVRDLPLTNFYIDYSTRNAFTYTEFICQCHPHSWMPAPYAPNTLTLV